jgi:enoyl-CoA hydratase/carnithine racemase
MAEFVLNEKRGTIGIITLNRPQVLNAWNTAMREELTATLTAMEENTEVRAIILTGAGTVRLTGG